MSDSPANTILSSLAGAPTTPVGEAAQEGEAQLEAAPEGTELSPEPTEEQKPKDFLAPKFAALSKKEKAVRQYEAQVKAKEAELNKRLAELEGRTKETETKSKSDEESFKNNPMKFLRDRGITMEQLIEMQMNDENPTVDMKLKRMQEELESKAMSRVEQLEKQLKDKEENEAKQQYEQAVAGYKREVSKFVAENAEAYELISANDATDLVFEVAEEYYKATQKVLDIEAAANAVEQHLEEEARKILKLKKLQKASTPEAIPQKKTAPTLSNTSAANVPSNGARRLSNEESLAAAAKLIRWEA